MAIDTELMASAFQSGAGFSALESRAFVTTLILLIALIWGMVMIVGWHQGLREARSRAEYVVMRILLLGMLLTVVTAVMFFS